MEGTFKKETGITLVALVITIIILLILAGISISQLSGSGLFENAQLAEKRSKNAQERENTVLSEYSNLINEYASGMASNVENAVKWTMNETTGEITGGGKTLNVGDYVNYQDKVTNATTDQLTALNTQLNTYSGTAGNALTNEELQWRVLDIVDGQLRLISATPTTKTVSTNKIYLSGVNGYSNAVYLIDNACKTLYNSNYASKVQNLKIEDIEEHLTWDYTQYANLYLKYGVSKTYSDASYRYYPSIYEKEKAGKIDIVEVSESKLDLSEQTEQDLIQYNLKQASFWIKITQTYWQKAMESSDFRNPMYYTLFINNGSNYAVYWMSSRCVDGDKAEASFFVRRVDSGYVRGMQLFYSSKKNSNGNYAFRPVITLKSNVTIGEGDGATTPYELNMK